MTVLKHLVIGFCFLVSVCFVAAAMGPFKKWVPRCVDAFGPVCTVVTK